MADDYLSHAFRDAGRVELRHQAGEIWTSGLFTDIGACRNAIRDRSGFGNLYTTINAPRLIAASNEMGGQALRDADIALHVRLPFDFDPVRPVGAPSTDAELEAACSARDRLVAALLGVGWPRPATAVSGNGAHALYRLRLAASAELGDMLAIAYRGMKDDFSTEAVDFDTTVRNPARIWRFYGSVNRKGAPTLDRPHRRAQVLIPGRWEAVSPRQVEALANAYARRRPVAVPTQRRHERIDGLGDYSTLAADAWFTAHDSYRRRLGGDKHAVRCPWAAEHSTDDDEQSTACVIWDCHDGVWPSFHCSHAHCDGRGIRDVLQIWRDADAFCSRAWAATP